MAVGTAWRKYKGVIITVLEIIRDPFDFKISAALFFFKMLLCSVGRNVF